MKSAFLSFSAFLLVFSASSAYGKHVQANVKIGTPFKITLTDDVDRVRKQVEISCEKVGEILESYDIRNSGGMMSYSSMCINGFCKTETTWEVTCLVKKPESMPLFSATTGSLSSLVPKLYNTTLQNDVAQEFQVKAKTDQCVGELLEKFSEYKKDDDIINAQNKLTELIGPFSILHEISIYTKDLTAVEIVNSNYESLKRVYNYDLSKKLNLSRDSKRCSITKEELLSFLNETISENDNSAEDALN